MWRSTGPRSNSEAGHPASFDSVLKSKEGEKLQLARGQARTHTFVNQTGSRTIGTRGGPGEMKQRHSPRDTQSQSLRSPLLHTASAHTTAGQLPTRDPFLVKPSLPACSFSDGPHRTGPWGPMALPPNTPLVAHASHCAGCVCFSAGRLDTRSPWWYLCFVHPGVPPPI